MSKTWWSDRVIESPVDMRVTLCVCDRDIDSVMMSIFKALAHDLPRAAQHKTSQTQQTHFRFVLTRIYDFTELPRINHTCVMALTNDWKN